MENKIKKLEKQKAKHQRKLIRKEGLVWFSKINTKIPLPNKFKKKCAATRISNQKVALLGRVVKEQSKKYNQFFIWNQITQELEQMPDMICGRKKFTCIFANNNLYAFGGKDQNDDLVKHDERFDFKNNGFCQTGDELIIFGFQEHGVFTMTYFDLNSTQVLSQVNLFKCQNFKKNRLFLFKSSNPNIICLFLIISNEKNSFLQYCFLVNLCTKQIKQYKIDQGQIFCQSINYKFPQVLFKNQWDIQKMEDVKIDFESQLTNLQLTFIQKDNKYKYRKLVIFQNVILDSFSKEPCNNIKDYSQLEILLEINSLYQIEIDKKTLEINFGYLPLEINSKNSISKLRFDNNTFIIVYNDGNSNYSRIYTYDLRTLQIAPLPECEIKVKTENSLFKVEDELYVVGQQNDNFQNQTIYKFNFQENKWTQIITLIDIYQINQIFSLKQELYIILHEKVDCIRIYHLSKQNEIIDKRILTICPDDDNQTENFDFMLQQVFIENNFLNFFVRKDKEIFFFSYDILKGDCGEQLFHQVFKLQENIEVKKYNILNLYAKVLLIQKDNRFLVFILQKPEEQKTKEEEQEKLDKFQVQFTQKINQIETYYFGEVIFDQF